DRRTSYCDQQPTLHGRSPFVIVTRQNRRIIPRTMARASARIMRLPEKLICGSADGAPPVSERMP
ncbi:MAG TPA: hypothetical protein VI029_18570, partial [Mycobacterium sp.]